MGEMNGYEFVYPKARAKEIAKVTDDHVMAAVSKDAAIIAITTNGTEVPIYEARGKSTLKAATTEQAAREKPGAPTPGNRTKRARPKQPR